MNFAEFSNPMNRDRKIVGESEDLLQRVLVKSQLRSQTLFECEKCYAESTSRILILVAMLTVRAYDAVPTV